MQTTHRFRRQPYRPGTLRVYWGIADRGDRPSVIYNGLKPDSHFLSYVLEGRRPALDLIKGTFRLEAEPSVLEELEARGYDLTTLKITIKKKP